MILAGARVVGGERGGGAPGMRRHPGWMSRMLGFSSCNVAVTRPHRPSPISGGASCVAGLRCACRASRVKCYCSISQ